MLHTIDEQQLQLLKSNPKLLLQQLDQARGQTAAQIDLVSEETEVPIEVVEEHRRKLEGQGVDLRHRPCFPYCTEVPYARPLR